MCMAKVNPLQCLKLVCAQATLRPTESSLRLVQNADKNAVGFMAMSRAKALSTSGTCATCAGAVVRSYGGSPAQSSSRGQAINEAFRSNLGGLPIGGFLTGSD